MSELHYQPLSTVCKALKSGALKSVDVTQHIIDRILRLEPHLKSYALLLVESAMAQAELADADHAAGKPLGALHGVPIAIKDLLYTQGVVTASGTQVMANFVPTYDATVVAKLRDAGAVIIGKTQLTEGAFGVHHPSIDPPKNPWNRDHWPGVSSSGSAVAVAAGLAYAALGTDTGGSIRFPSASCGLVGIKPTYGRVSRHGAFALAHSMDHIGPMTRTVEDAARILSVIAGQDSHDSSSLDAAVPNYSYPVTRDMQGVRIGVDWHYVSAGVDTELVSLIRQACDSYAQAGATIKEITLPQEYKILVQQWGVTCGYECAQAHARYYPAQASLYGPVLSSLIELGLATSPTQYAALEKVRGVFRLKLDVLMNDVDLLISPCMTSVAPTVEEMSRTASSDDGRAEFITFTAPFDYSGHPTITLPAGLNSAGLPLSYQLVGRHLEEALLIRAGYTHEQVLGEMVHPALPCEGD